MREKLLNISQEVLLGALGTPILMLALTRQMPLTERAMLISVVFIRHFGMFIRALLMFVKTRLLRLIQHETAGEAASIRVDTKQAVLVPARESLPATNHVKH